MSNYLSNSNALFTVLLISPMILLFACGQGRGFALPEGNEDAGKSAFIRFNCNDCHSTGDIEFSGSNDGLHVRLGGETTKLKTYGELVTSVINPSHKVAKKYRSATESSSEMKIYNEVMTVQELVDIVTYLQSEYKFVVPETPYPCY